VPFGGISTGDRNVSDCLPDTFRPQSFSLSRRLHPTGASRLCFTPLPPIGFRPPELFPRDQPWHLSMPVGSLVVQHRTCRGFRLGRHDASTSEHCSGCASDTRRPAIHSPPGRCSPGLSPLRGLPDTVAGPKPSLRALHYARTPRRSMACGTPLRLKVLRPHLGTTPKS
jgi:hypothetical protein